MAIKAIINNTEKEIEQIKNSDEQDIDYVYSRIGDTEVEGEPPISIKSIGGNLADYRIYGNTVGGESVGNRTENILNELPQNRTNKGITFTNYDNKYIRITGISSDVYAQTDAAIIYLEAGTYSIRFFSKNSEFNTNIFVLLRHLDNTNIITINVNGGTFTLNNGETVRFITGVIQNNVEINTDVYYMVIKQSQIPDEYEPYGYKIPITNNSKTANIYLDAPLRKVGDEAEYISYAEQKMHRIGADDIDVTLPALPTLPGTNTFSVNTSIQPSNIYIKDGFDYKKVFTATRVIEDELPLSYRSIEDNDSTLDNYRIYGNTVGGESVGDRTGNLFDKSGSQYGNNLHWVPARGLIYSDAYYGSPIMDVTGLNTITRSYTGTSANYFLTSDLSQFVNVSNVGTVDAGVTVNVPDGYTKYVFNIPNTIRPDSIMVNSGSTALPYEAYGYKVPVTVKGKNLINLSIYEIRNAGVEYTVNNDKSITANGSTSSKFSLFLVKVYLTKGSYIISGCPQNGSQNTYRCEIRDMVLTSLAQDTGAGIKYSIVTDGYYYYSIRIAQNYVCNNLTFYPMIRKADIEDDTYEPYHAPVTTPIYLPEPIKMVGDEAEYIDYAEQKMHRIGADDLGVTLPALPTLTGTNVLSVGTAVQPSSVEIKGHIK